MLRYRDNYKRIDFYTINDLNYKDISADMEVSNTAVPKKGHHQLPIEDIFSILLLFVLYTLQGIPMGLSGSIPLIMKERGVSYEALSLFSMVSLPFSLKLVWAPFVDSLYFAKMGRRKTWLVPVQLLCGLVMIISSNYMDGWIGSDSNDIDNNVAPNAMVLTVFFMFLYFLMATQDIAVDGWALTMLTRENVGYASICNAIGQSFGYFLANQGFIALSDPIWCHRFLGLSYGKTLLSLSSFLNFWGFVFIITTIIVWVLKKENPIIEGEEPAGLVETYRQVIAIFKLKSVQLLCMVLITCKIAIAPITSASSFKMQENGMPKADIASISPILMIIGLVVPALVSRHAATKPVELFLMGTMLRLLSSFLTYCMVILTWYAYGNGNNVPGLWYFVLLIPISIFHEVTGSFVFVGLMSFFSRISDPAIGGTYMTVLNTITNFGNLLPNTVSLWIIPKLTFSHCVSVHSSDYNLLDGRNSNCIAHKSECSAAGGVCHIDIDGFTVTTFLCLAFGVFWIFFLRKPVLLLQSMPFSNWLVSTKIDTNSCRIVSEREIWDNKATQ